MVLLAGALDQVQLSLEELPCQNLLLRSHARWRQIAARDNQDGIAVVGVAIHAVAIATEEWICCCANSGLWRTSCPAR